MSVESSASGFDHSPTFGVDAITASTGRSDWLVDALHQFDAIRKLPNGWDSYGGNAINGEIVAAAEKLARNLSLLPEVPRPHVSPTSGGGVQLEWESSDGYFEIHFEEPTQAQCYFESASPPAEKEFTFHEGDDVSVLAKHVSRVSGS